MVGCGANCLNEGFLSETTPCLAWSLLYQDRGIMWVCEGDTSSLMTQYLMGKTIDSAIFTTNIYPFLSGMPALSHEKIQEFPDVPDPTITHCWYTAVIWAAYHSACPESGPCARRYLAGIPGIW